MITVYTDGACRVSNPGLCSAAFVVYDNDVEVACQAGDIPDLHTNNYAEYTGVLNALLWLSTHRYTCVEIFCDSKLVVEQVNGNWKCLKQDLLPLLKLSQYYFMKGQYKLTHIDGHAGNVGNERADELCNDILDRVQKKGKYEE